MSQGYELVCLGYPLPTLHVLREDTERLQITSYVLADSPVQRTVSTYKILALLLCPRLPNMTNNRETHVAKFECAAS
jgi:hypothetical protein